MRCQGKSQCNTVNANPYRCLNQQDGFRYTILLLEIKYDQQKTQQRVSVTVMDLRVRLLSSSPASPQQATAYFHSHHDGFKIRQNKSFPK